MANQQAIKDFQQAWETGFQIVAAMQRHYEKLDKFAIARRNVERRLAGVVSVTIKANEPLRAGCARPVDNDQDMPQAITA